METTSPYIILGNGVNQDHSQGASTLYQPRLA